MTELPLPPKIEIPSGRIVNATVHLPGSKSLTNRALVLAALAEGETTITGFLYSDDTKYMVSAWRNLGVSIVFDTYKAIVSGCGGRIAPYGGDLYIENAGTVARFLTALLPLGQGTYHLRGNARMHARPIGPLVRALNRMGCQISAKQAANCLPLQIKGTGLKGGHIYVEGEESSQFISAILMAAPFAQMDVQLSIQGSLVSRTYVDMTQHMMKAFGVECFWQARDCILIPAGQAYNACHFKMEGDASSASYFLAAAALTQGSITLTGLNRDSTQGDLGLIKVLEKMGCHVKWHSQYELTLTGAPLRALEVDMNTMSDVAPTLAIVALFAKGKTTISNVANMRLKECDRIAALCRELKKIGAEVTELADGLSIIGQKDLQAREIETYHDHRIAMAFAVAGLKIPGLVIKNPQCVSKTFPNFFEVFLPLIA